MVNSNFFLQEKHRGKNFPPKKNNSKLLWIASKMYVHTGHFYFWS